jgi:hypothetical protein
VADGVPEHAPSTATKAAAKKNRKRENRKRDGNGRVDKRIDTMGMKNSWFGCYSKYILFFTKKQEKNQIFPEMSFLCDEFH